MTKLRAHFDGKVFVPDEPVDLPAGKRVEVVVDDLEFDIHPVSGLPVFRVGPDAPPITSEDVRRAMDDEGL